MKQSNEIERPDNWETCESKSHWIDILVYGKCEVCGEYWRKLSNNNKYERVTNHKNL